MVSGWQLYFPQMEKYNWGGWHGENLQNEKRMQGGGRGTLNCRDRGGVRDGRAGAAGGNLRTCGVPETRTVSRSEMGFAVEEQVCVDGAGKRVSGRK